MAKIEFKLKPIWFQGQCPIKKREFQCGVAARDSRACLFSWLPREERLPWLGFRTPEPPLPMVWWNRHPARCCQLQWHVFPSPCPCISVDLILLCSVWALLAHVAFLSRRGVCIKERISSASFRLPFRAEPASVHIVGAHSTFTMKWWLCVGVESKGCGVSEVPWDLP